MRLKLFVPKPASGRIVPNTIVSPSAVTGRTLVLHADKKGMPGKAIACGTIEQTDEP